MPVTGTSKPPLKGQEYRSVFTLYSKDGRRLADVLEFQNGETYLDEREWIEGTTFKNRHGGSLVGPFASAEDAEKFIVATQWFREPQRLRRVIAVTIIAILLLITGSAVFAWYTEHNAEISICHSHPGTKYNVVKSQCD